MQIFSRPATDMLQPTRRSAVFTPLTQAGFSLIELLLALVILGVLAGVAIPGYMSHIEDARNKQAIADILRIEGAIERFRVNNADALPADLAAVGMGGMTDPWGRAYVYQELRSVHGNGQSRKDHNLVPINTDYDLYSMGPDGASQKPLTAKASRDDVVRANNGGWVGPAAEY